MKINRTNVLRGLCIVGYGLFIVSALIQSFDAFSQDALLHEIGRCGLGFGASTMLIYLLNRNGRICALKRKLGRN